MPNTQKTSTLLAVLLILIALSLACTRSAQRQPGTVDREPIPVTTEAVKQMEDNIEAAAGAYLSGAPFTLLLTEAQLTSSANLELQSLQDNQIKNIQIYLQDDLITFLADFSQNSFTIPINVTISVFVNASGQIGYEIITAKMGPFPIPDGAVGQITDQLDQYILTELNPAATGIVIDRIQIADGTLTISGQQN